MFVPGDFLLVYILLVREGLLDKSSMLGRGEPVRRCQRLYMCGAGGSHVGCQQALPPRGCGYDGFLRTAFPVCKWPWPVQASSPPVRVLRSGTSRFPVGPGRGARWDGEGVVVPKSSGASPCWQSVVLERMEMVLKKCVWGPTDGISLR